jgi:hypothetical protein
MSRNEWWKWLEENRWYVWGPVFMVLGWAIGHFIEPHWSSHVVTESAIALWIAGLLMVTVDPFIKRLARREATRDIFHHMLGYKLPPIIRERLEKIVNDTKLYRENTSMRIDMSEKGNFVIFDVEMELDVVNAAPHTLDFSPLIQFEKGESAELKRIICFGDPKYGENAVLSPAKGGLGAAEYRGKKVPIPSEDRKKIQIRVLSKISYGSGLLVPEFQLADDWLVADYQAPGQLQSEGNRECLLHPWSFEGPPDHDRTSLAI